MATPETIAMSTALEQSPVEPLPIEEESPYLFSVGEFYQLLEIEFFPREARVGLWDGRIYEKMSKTQAHAVAGNKVNRFLVRALPDGWFVGGENPVAVSPTRAPLPDLIILRGEPDDYNARRPTANDVGLVVELSLSSLKSDTGAKLAAYAAAGIPVYWVANLVDGVLLVYSEPIPSESRYASKATFKPGDSFAIILDGVQVALVAASDLLPLG
jgi:Uma2 family endonuclease